MINLPTLYVLWKGYHQIDDEKFDDKDIIPSFVCSLKEPEDATELIAYALMQGYSRRAVDEYCDSLISMSDEQQQEEWVQFYKLHGVV